MLKRRGRKAKDPKPAEPIKTTQQTAPQLQTTEAEPDNRQLVYRKNPNCPKCDAHPVVCTYRDRERAFFRCRECGHRWEVKR